jgi:hypothetical protein
MKELKLIVESGAVVNIPMKVKVTDLNDERYCVWVEKGDHCMWLNKSEAINCGILEEVESLPAVGDVYRDDMGQTREIMAISNAYVWYIYRSDGCESANGMPRKVMSDWGERA